MWLGYNSVEIPDECEKLDIGGCEPVRTAFIRASN